MDIGSAVAVRLTQITGKSKFPIHPKHFLTNTPWFVKYLNKSDVVLDLGCGNGQNTLKAARKAKKLVGIDLNDNLLAIAKKSLEQKKNNNIVFRKANLEEKLNFKNDYFDKIIFLDVLEHLNNRNQIMAEIERILKPNGLLLLGVPNSQTSWKKLQRSAGICSYSDPDHKVEFSKNQIEKLISKYFKIQVLGYSTYDTPFRGLIDIIGGLSISSYRRISDWRKQKAVNHPREASGFEIVAIKK